MKSFFQFAAKRPEQTLYATAILMGLGAIGLNTTVVNPPVDKTGRLIEIKHGVTQISEKTPFELAYRR